MNKKRTVGKLYGGLNMGWPAVLLLAVLSAALTAVFLIVPVFQNTSFQRMGVYLEAWVFLAILIMSNCKSPLESAMKTFVFFLVSQPLIYLLQVPFSWQGWGLFGYYKYWFIATLLTFPAAYIGWYIKKRNWLSLLILSPILCLLAYTCAEGAQRFPRLIVTTLFCLGQIVAYLLVFTKTPAQRLTGLALSICAAAAVLLLRPAMNFDTAMFLPDDPVLTENAEVVEGGEGTIAVSVERTGPDSMVRIRAAAFGDADFTIRDGDKEYRYTVVVYEDDAGHSQVEIKER